MKLFLHCAEDGRILCVAKVQAASPGHHPFAHVGEPDRTVEVSATAELEALAPHEILEQYEYDLRTRLLRKKATSAPQKAAPKKTRKTNPE